MADVKLLVARVSLEMKHLWPTQIGHWLTGQVIRASRCSHGTGIGKLEEDLSSEVPYSDVNSTGNQPALAVFAVWLKMYLFEFWIQCFLVIGLIVNLRVVLLVWATLKINLENTLDERYIWKNQFSSARSFKTYDIYLNECGLLLWYIDLHYVSY